MRSAVLRDGRMHVRDDVDDPHPGPGQLLVEVAACGICGSDLHFVRHGATMLELGSRMEGTPDLGGEPTDLSRDVFMGHEFSGRVLEVGPDGDGPAEGTLVTSVPIMVTDDGHPEPRLHQRVPVRVQRAHAAVVAARHRGAQRPRPAPRRADRADGGRAARRQPVGDRHRATARS